MKVIVWRRDGVTSRLCVFSKGPYTRRIIESRTPTYTSITLVHRKEKPIAVATVYTDLFTNTQDRTAPTFPTGPLIDFRATMPGFAPTTVGVSLSPVPPAVPTTAPMLVLTLRPPSPTEARLATTLGAELGIGLMSTAAVGAVAAALVYAVESVKLSQSLYSTGNSKGHS